jgi:hypothetical protein
MVRADRAKLGPLVEAADEAFTGGLEEEKPGRGAEKKSRIAVAVEFSEKSGKLGHIRLAVMPEPDASAVHHSSHSSLKMLNLMLKSCYRWLDGLPSSFQRGFLSRSQKRRMMRRCHMPILLYPF